jgi:cytidylate kinase/diadenosine tetraphosphate (Ap4A) HIT family hydrolase
VSCNLCRFDRDRFLIDSGDDGAILVDRAPMMKGHLLVVSREHSPSVEDLPGATRRRFLARAERARRLASDIAGREAMLIEHGRSPTCGDPSCSCHAHVHAVPVDTSQEGLRAIDFLSPTRSGDEGPYLSFSAKRDDRRFFVLSRPVRHASRTVAAAIASENGIPWQPFVVAPTTTWADETLKAARDLLGQRRAEPTRHTPARPARREEGGGGRNGTKPVIAVSGPTGSGKTSVGAHLARRLGVPAIELGVVLRLVALDRRGTDARTAARLWRWSRKGRIDFDGASIHRLAAAVPRLDGGAHELPMWTDVEADRLAAIARREDIQDVLSAIAEQVAATSGGVIVGRVPPRLVRIEPFEISLDAAPRERARRKRAQLAHIGLDAGRHDWFSPRQGATVVGPERETALDTTRLDLAAMCRAAELLAGEGETEGRLQVS